MAQIEGQVPAHACPQQGILEPPLPSACATALSTLNRARQLKDIWGNALLASGIDDGAVPEFFSPQERLDLQVQLYRHRCFTRSQADGDWSDWVHLKDFVVYRLACIERDCASSAFPALLGAFNATGAAETGWPEPGQGVLLEAGGILIDTDDPSYPEQRTARLQNLEQQKWQLGLLIGMVGQVLEAYAPAPPPMELSAAPLGVYGLALGAPAPDRGSTNLREDRVQGSLDAAGQAS